MIGALIGGGLDYALQVSENIIEDGVSTSAFTDVDGSSIAISAASGAIGAGLASKINKIYKVGSKAAKAANLVSDGTVNAVQQAAKNDGEVDVTDVMVSVIAGQAIKNPIKTKVKNSASNTGKIKVLEKQANRTSRLAKTGKQSRIDKDAKAQKALNREKSIQDFKAGLSGAATSGGVTKTINTLTEKDKEKNQ